MKLRLEDLEATKIFYEKELKEDLSGGEKISYLRALKLIEVFIHEEKKAERKSAIDCT